MGSKGKGAISPGGAIDRSDRAHGGHILNGKVCFFGEEQSFECPYIETFLFFSYIERPMHDIGYTTIYSYHNHRTPSWPKLPHSDNRGLINSPVQRRTSSVFSFFMV